MARRGRDPAPPAPQRFRCRRVRAAGCGAGKPRRVPGLAVDLPGHGDSDPPRDRAGFAFGALADDVVEALDRLGADRVSCVGESLGGGVGILADRARPGLINRLVLCEAVAFDLGGRVDGENPMVAGARRRRRCWPSLEAARAASARRPPLADLSRDALDGYLRWGTFAAGEGVCLACDPEHEATIFEVSAEPGGAADAWDRQATRVGCPHEVLPGGHLFLHEDTARVAALVRGHLRRSHGGATRDEPRLASQGFEIRPRREMTGGATFNEIFFCDGRASRRTILEHVTVSVSHLIVGEDHGAPRRRRGLGPENRLHPWSRREPRDVARGRCRCSRSTMRW